jgi:tetratricopeptide (TPR) repeat protein
VPHPDVVSYIIVKSNYFSRPCQIIRGRNARGFLVALLLGQAFFAGAQAAAGISFKEGEAAFMRNKPAEAAPRLEAALREDPANLTASLYLGIAYQQLGRFDDAVATLRAALPRSGERSALFAYNIANAYFSKGSAVFAEQFYTRAIDADPSYASAFLNRANARIKTGALKDASADYAKYLELEPATPKRPEIERVMALIADSFAAQEREKLAAEAAAKDEEARRKRLLDEVSASLQAAAEETQGLSAGSEQVEQYDGEFVLE